MNTDLGNVLEIDGQNDSNASGNERNKIAEIINIIGYLTLCIGIIVGLIVGLTLKEPKIGYEYLTDPHPLRWIYGGAIILSSFISGIVFIGFGEIINLLNKISLKNT